MVADKVWALVLLVWAAMGVCSCGAATSDNAEPSYGVPGSNGAGGSGHNGTGGSAGSGLGGTGGSAGAPPEKELESSYESPVATRRYVWIANPMSGQVAYVDAQTLEVRTVAAGHGPKYLAAVPHESDDIAVVLNIQSQDATILRGKGEGQVAAKNIGVHAGANSWSVSRLGRWAIAWSDARLVTGADPIEGFQDLTVLDMTEGSETATRLSAGYRPVAVSFSNDEKNAFAVSQDGISVIDLSLSTGPAATKFVLISDNPFEDTVARDVIVTPDGAWALVRVDDADRVTVVSLTKNSLTNIPLPGVCTDLDVASDGTKAIAAIRDRGQVAIFDIASIWSNPSAYELVPVDNATVGSVSVASEVPVALLYTNALAEQRITVLSFASIPATAHTLKLHAPVMAALPASDATNAIVLHQPMSGVPGAFSVLNLVPELPAKVVATMAPIAGVVLTPSGTRAVVAEKQTSTKTYGAYLVWGPTQQVDRYALASPPIAVGAVLGANRGYVAQEHPEGRITFIDFETGLSRTLTGFELGGHVVDGSKP